MKILGIIPARLASTRLPGKPLIEIEGKTIIQRVYERAKQAKLLTDVIVATDDQRIFDHIASRGGKVMLTDAAHRNGTERCAEVAAKYGDEYDVVINVQGDEPFIHPDQIDLLANFMATTTFQIGTLVKKITSESTLFKSSIIKVVFNQQNSALYFSRQAIPFIRNHPENWLKYHTFYKHIGMYAFRTKVIQEVAKLKPTLLEQAEMLEQLRWMQHGYTIGVEETELETIGIDTPEDLERVRTIDG